MTDKITSKASFFQKLKRRRAEKKSDNPAKRKIALENLEAAIELSRQRGRHKAIKNAFGEYMTELYPVSKGKVAT